MRLLLILLLLLISTSCKQKIEGLGIPLTLEKKTLTNGLTMIFVEDHTFPIITYQTWVKVGSVDEHLGSTGLSHLFEHLMFKGTKKYGPKQFFLELEAKGAEVNAFTTRDYTVFHETFTPDLLEKVISMESDRLVNLQLSDEILNSERQVVLEERRLRTENVPSGKIQETLWALAYKRHPYRFPVIGILQDLLNFTLKDITSFYQTYYQPGNVTLVLVGDFQSSAAFSLITKYYEKITGFTRSPRNIPQEIEQDEERRYTLYDQVLSSQFAVAYHVTSALDDDSYALDVLANILFEGTSSRAYHSIVEEKNIALNISGIAYTPTYNGLFIISGTMREEKNVEEVEVVLQNLIKEVQEKGVLDDEIKMAVKQLTVGLVDNVRTPYGLGQLIGTVMMIFEDPNRFAEDLTKYLRVTSADVKRVAQRYLGQNNRTMVIMLPEKGRKK
ncbi:MAG: insulinase family protein [Bdellovibrio sp.]|nr:insulinase family protein [Bdellovibrio sp.]